MKDAIVLQVREESTDRSIILEDDGRVAYAYLLEHGKIVADVWLYNVVDPPEHVDWSDRSQMPPLNPKSFCTKDRLPRLSLNSKVDCVWFENGVEIGADGVYMARLERGAKPGWSRLALLPGPLAKPLRIRTSFVAELGTDSYRHRFGGTEWSIVAPAGTFPPPTTLLTLDLSDPRLSIASDIRELPLCSRIDGGTTLERQSYVFDLERRSITFEGPPWQVQMDPAGLLTLPQRELRLRPPVGAEDPEVASKYDVQDTLVGGSAFIRVRGGPIWLAAPEEVQCRCGRAAEFIAAIGYESQPSGIIEKPFFIGELALYFFACLPCRRAVVVSQST